MPLIPCPACENPVSDQAPSCPRCGHPLQAAAPAPATLPAVRSGPAPVAEEEDPFRCDCGVWNRQGAQRCASCGRGLGLVGGRRPVHYVHTAPLPHPARPTPERERQGARTRRRRRWGRCR